MNKNLRLSLIAIACSLAITACSSDNKGATRYENLVKNKTEEATKQAEEKAKRAQESDTAKKLADLEKKQKELEAELAKKQNGNTAAPSVSGNVPSNVITPSTPAKSKDVEEAKPTEKKKPEVKASVGKVLSTEEAKKALEGAFKDNGLDGSNIKLSGSILTVTDSTYTTTNISSESNNNLNELIVDGHTITLYSADDLKNDLGDMKSKILTDSSGKVGALPPSKLKSNFEQVRYGYTTKNGKTALFVQGYLTPTSKDKVSSPFNYWYEAKGQKSTQVLGEMPTSDVYEYHGTAFYGKDNKYNELTAKGYADFGEKKVKVDLLDGNQTKLTLGGNITNNTFEGNYQGVITKGAFFGNKAIDMAGMFYQTSEGSEKGMNGVFGATQQNCGYTSCSPVTNKNLKDFNLDKQ
ncbi:transferrin-binding protein-like solute binding protein [Actinobacillus equuli subsp. haemolyticus]|uniref:transferrin-binding protein-like solute binding protein n=1 Tax=Actinobacillus equuli TaxID=718 RepID=UPI002441F7EB|nr:transferrin-binding protein-like solute binding protein [Actinobacillus equuli]WGE41568.1 transferrin-binding protein-like solute binding protein [Actinobacillus equuli subsp. haemolyticus]WGE66759.1 transferrin-binding protein-like solute binding protein [Actinobacillus equuli subsp. haemolyticus]WGE74806.1 transferrin-binding protein-like solute binding protein [Actinobacillus equuli subsp. haemolyticus]WGE76719.1 transferrin-binding protein-like solute binding protein [Actinobacillus equu